MREWTVVHATGKALGIMANNAIDAILKSGWELEEIVSVICVVY